MTTLDTYTADDGFGVCATSNHRRTDTMPTTLQERAEALARIICESRTKGEAWERCCCLFPQVTEAELDAAFQEALKMPADESVDEAAIHVVQDEQRRWAVVHSQAAAPSIVYSGLASNLAAELARDHYIEALRTDGRCGPDFAPPHFFEMRARLADFLRAHCHIYEQEATRLALELAKYEPWQNQTAPLGSDDLPF